MRERVRGPSRALAMMAMVLAVVGPVPAAAESDSARSDGVAAREARTPPGTAVAAQYDRAAARARDEGTVLVSVELVVPWAPEARLSRTQSNGQRGDIARAVAQVRAELRGVEHEVVHEPTVIPHMALRLSPEAVEALRGSDAVASVTEPVELSPALAQSGPLIGADRGHDRGHTGSGRAVAVIDTGVDLDHPFFGDRIVASACFSSSSDCPNGSTVDTTSPDAGEACTYSWRCEHGTHVAGIAVGDDGADLQGVAAGGGLVAINAAHRSEPNSDPAFISSDIVAALEHVALLAETQDIASVNLSLGGPVEYTTACDGAAWWMAGYDDAVAQLTSAGIAVVAASGNDGFTNGVAWPACNSLTVSVGNTTKSDVVHSTSNSGDLLDLLAPGTQITAAVPGGGYTSRTGTSMAAPQVAGALAVLASAMPTLTLPELVGVLRDTGVPVTDGRAATGGRVTPRIDVWAALSSFVGPCPPDDVYEDNDTLATPADMPSTLSLAAELCAGDADVFAFRATGGSVTTSLAFTHAWGDLDLEVWDATGTTLIAAATSDTDDETITAVLSSGDHLMRVLGRGDTDQTGYTLDVTGAATRRPPPAPVNDRFDDAIALIPATAGSTTGSNDHAGVEDSGEPGGVAPPPTSTVWWKWVAPAAGEARFDTRGTGFSAVLDVFSGTELGTLVHEGGAMRDAGAVSVPVEEGDELRVRIDGVDVADGVDTGSITLNWCLDDLHEPDDTREAATPLVPGQSVDAIICDEADHFSIEAETGQTIHAELTWAPVDDPVTLRLLRSDGSVLDEARAATGGQASVSADVAAGAHVLQVANEGGARPSYALVATTHGPSPSPAPTSPPTPAPDEDEVGVSPSKPVISGELAIERLAGDDRVATAARISAESFPTASTVVVARADTYPDALAGAPLAAQLGGPILLTDSDGLSAATRSEILRLGAQRIVLLGGEGALSSHVQADLALLGLDVDRVAGSDRFDTARRIALAVGGTRVYVTEGANADPNRGWPDAVAVSALAAHEQRPILLVRRGDLPPATGRAIAELGATAATIVGGEGAVSSVVDAALGRHGVAVERVAGDDRFHTSRLLVERAEAAGMSPARPWLATGANFPDALVAGPAVASDGGVLLFVHGQALTASAASYEWIQSRAGGFSRVVVAGGPQVVSEMVVDQVQAAFGAAREGT